MKRILIAMLALAGAARAGVAVNEIMYTPPAGAPEWVEMFNAGADSVSTAGWTIRDAGATRHPIAKTRIPPGGYLVLVKDTTLFRSIFGSGAELAAVTLPSLNNSGDAVVIDDSSGAKVDSVVFKSSWGGTGGRSLERREASAPANLTANWGTTLDRAGGTPGRINTLFRRDHDRALDSIWSEPISAFAHALHARVRNIGRSLLQTAQIEIYRDANADSIGDASEHLASAMIPVLAVDSFVVISIRTPDLPRGTSMLVASIDTAGDDQSANNSAVIELASGADTGQVVINEIMAAPPAGEPEWVEIVARAETDLAGWKVGTATISTDLLHLARGEFAVLTRDSSELMIAHPSLPARIIRSSLPTLSNSGGAVVLRDARGLAIDSAGYLGDWMTSGCSLERRDTAAASASRGNWRVSTDPERSTPGRENSTARRMHDLGVAGIEIGDDIRVTVRNEGRVAESGGRVAGYRVAGADTLALAAEVFGEIAAGDSIEVEIPSPGVAFGRTRILARSILEGDQDRTNDTASAIDARGISAGAVAINEVMFAPASGGSEYVEIAGVSDTAVGLDGARLIVQSAGSSNQDTIHLPPTLAALRRGSFAVIARDTSILHLFPELRGDSLLAFAGSALSLANGGGTIRLEDPTGTALDAVRFDPSMHNPDIGSSTGIALERVAISLATDAPGNWASSAAARGGTPGSANSVFLPATGATAQLGASPNPFSPDGDGREDHTIVSFTTAAPQVIYSLRIFDSRGRIVRRLADEARASAAGNVIWDGRDDGGERVPAGPYVALLESIAPGDGEATTSKAVIVVARR
jgi:hypothetical protein